MASSFDRDAFFQKDYEWRITYFTNHLTRMWTRFGMFVTLESALVAVLVVQGTLSNVAAEIAGVEAGLSLLWLSMGRHDRLLVRIYRQQIRDAAGRLDLPDDYRIVSDVESQPTAWWNPIEAPKANDVPLFPALIPALLLVGWLAGCGLIIAFK
jgi:hypothetical protein